MPSVLRMVLRILLLLIIIGVAVYGVLAIRATPMSSHPFFQNDDPDVLVIAHQGGDGERPSNTMVAFQYATEIGVDVLEMDIHSTSDGVLVTIHDATVDRTTNGTGRVHEMTFAELQKLDAGYDWPTVEEEAHRTDRPYRGQGVVIPALEEVFQTFPEIRMVIEIKQQEPSIVEPFCNLLREYNLQEQVIVASFYPDTMYAFRERCPEVATSAVEEEILPFFVLSTIGLSGAYQPAAESFQVPEYSGDFHIVTESFVRNAHAKNVMVQPWTINSTEQMQRMMNVEVNGIMTDYPARLLELLGRGE